jgi:putative heme-binding domain-containing protein
MNGNESTPAPLAMRFAKPAIACLLIAWATMWAVGYLFVTPAPIISGDAATQEADPLLQTGKVWFERRCRACHFSAGAYGVSRGPDLSQIGRLAADRKPGLSVEEYLLESILKPSAFRPPGLRGADMPDNIVAGIDEDGLRGLVYYLSSLGGEPDGEKIRQLKITPLSVTAATASVASRAQIERGRQLYEGKLGCAKCHPLVFSPGIELFAPAILGVGLLPEDELENAIFRPHARIKTGYEQVLLKLPDGRTKTGRLLLHDKVRIRILENVDGIPTPFEARLSDESGKEIEVVRLPQSAMPDNYEKLLSAEEKADFLAFLRALVAGW